MSFDLVRIKDVDKNRLRATIVGKKIKRSVERVKNFLNENNEYYHSAYEIAEKLNYSYSTVKKALKILEENDEIEIIKMHGSNKYFYSLKEIVTKKE